jgi:hypothetical protein
MDFISNRNGGTEFETPAREWAELTTDPVNNGRVIADTGERLVLLEVGPENEVTEIVDSGDSVDVTVQYDLDYVSTMLADSFDSLTAAERDAVIDMYEREIAITIFDEVVLDPLATFVDSTVYCSAMSDDDMATRIVSAVGIDRELALSIAESMNDWWSRSASVPAELAESNAYAGEIELTA